MPMLEMQTMSDCEDDYAYAARALPTPTDTPYRTPSNSVSRQSFHRRDSLPGPSSSPPPFPPSNDFFSKGREEVVDMASNENISPLDPRRFTPTLHASLVSEILSLRRDLEGKSKTIDSLETSLDDARTENESLNETLSKNLKEGRSAKRQLQLLEGGNLSTLTELSKERDEALDNISDVRKRLEQAQKKVRTQEEEVERTQMLWDRDKQNWEGERRNLERKVHIVEGRLKVVLNEVAAAQANPYPRSSDGEFNDTSRGSVTARGSDTTSIRSNSVTGRRRTSTASVSTHDGEPNGLRYSVMSMASGYGTKLDGLNLADELAFDEEEEDNINDIDNDDMPYSPEALPEERPISSQSRTMGMKARKLLGLSLDVTEDVGTTDSLEDLTPVERTSGYGQDENYPTPLPRVEYMDAGVQYSPPPSPTLSAHREHSPVQDLSDQTREEAGGDQERDVSIQVSMPDNQPKENRPSIDMVSISCQTVGELPSPPWTPKLENNVVAIRDADKLPMTSSSTQTEEEPVLPSVDDSPNTNDPDELHMFVPTIAIHPPGSSPSSPRNSVVLPPQTKNASCQTDVKPIVEVRSYAMQTEEIRIDRRPVKLPASLLPSAIPDQSNTADTADASSEPPIPPYRPPPPRSSRRKLRSPPVVEPASVKAAKGKQPEKLQAYPGNNDNGPLAEEDLSPDIRRPFRSSSLFAGFENNSDDEFPEMGALDAFSDDDILNRPMVTCTLRSGKMVSKPSPSILDDNPLQEMDEPDSNTEVDLNDYEIPTGSVQNGLTRGKSSNGKRPPRSSKLASGSKQKDIRRTAMISSGAAVHQSSRPRSPSAPSIGSVGSSTSGAKPPFPVPMRLSSRKVPTSASEGAQSPTPYSNGNYPERGGRLLKREPTLRKVRSAAAVPRGEEQDRARSRSPPPTLSTSSAAPDSPQLPPMPYDEITAPRRQRNPKAKAHRPAPSKAYSHSRDNSTATSVQQTSVVDAIAQTMVGEWMWKYVRKRKSFGVPDSSKDNWDIGKSSEEVSANITGNGVRHKRWVWLAPYERAVMWSSKQPTNGTALLGKSGRKLTIQSVLDVKDDNPLPKGSNPQNQFNRSILILTPQRALKFTAMTVERHYIWLTALSFLSHSAIGANDLATLPPVPPQSDYVPPPPSAALRRNPIRDSIRVAKSKPRPTPNNNRAFTAHASPVPVPELPTDEVDGGQPIAEAASPPNVPRHSRKRSNTAPRAPPSAFRSFSSHNSNQNSNHAPKPSTYSATTNGSSDIYAPSSVGAQGVQSGQSSFSRRTSEASGPSSVGMNNFFDAVGTVRMEAFIDRTEMARQRVGQRSRNAGRKRDPGYWGQSPDTEGPRSEDGSEIFFRHDDPFRGF